MPKLPLDNLVPTRFFAILKSVILSVTIFTALFSTLVFNPTQVRADYAAPSCVGLTINDFYYTIDSDLSQTQYGLGTNSIPEDAPVTIQLNDGNLCEIEAQAQLAQAELDDPDTFWMLTYDWTVTGKDTGNGPNYSFTFPDQGQETLNFALILGGFNPNTGDSPYIQLGQTIFNLNVSGPPVIPDVTLNTVTIEFLGQRVTIPENYNLKVDSRPAAIGIDNAQNQDTVYLNDPTEFANLSYEWVLTNITETPFEVSSSTEQIFDFDQIPNTFAGIPQNYELTLTISDPNDSQRFSTDTISFTTIASVTPTFEVSTEQENIYDVPKGEGFCFEITLNPNDFADELFNPLFNSVFTIGIADGAVIADQEDFTPENLTVEHCVSLEDLPNKFLPSLEFNVEGIFDIDNGDHTFNTIFDQKPKELENLADFLSPDVVDLSIISRNSFQINFDENLGTKTDWSLGKVIPNGTNLDFAIYNPETAQFENCTEDRSGIYACLNLSRPILQDLSTPQTILDVNNDLFTNPLQYEKSYFLFRPQDLTLETPNLNVIQFAVVPTYFFLTDANYTTVLNEIQVGQPNYFVLRDPVKSYDQNIEDTEKVSLDKTPLFNLVEVGDTGVFKGSYTFTDEITETKNVDLAIEVRSATLSTPILAKYQPPYLDKGLEYNGSESFRTPAPVISDDLEFSPYYFVTEQRDSANGFDFTYTNLNLEGSTETYQNEPIFSSKNQGSALIYISNPELVSPDAPGNDAGPPPDFGGGGGGAIPGFGGGGMIQAPKGSLELASLDQDIFLSSTLFAEKDGPAPEPDEETLYPGLSLILKNFITEGQDTTYTYVYSITSNLVQGWNRVNFYESNLFNTQSSPNEFLNADFDKISDWQVTLLYRYNQAGPDLEFGLKDYGFYNLANAKESTKSYLAVYTPPAPEPEPEPETPAPSNNSGTSSGSSASPSAPQAPQAPNAPVLPQSPTLPSAPENPTTPASPEAPTDSTEDTTPESEQDQDQTYGEDDSTNDSTNGSSSSSDDGEQPSSEDSSSETSQGSSSSSQDTQFFFAPGTPAEEQTLDNVQFEPIPVAELQACGERIQFYQQDGGIDTDGDGCSDGFEKAFGSDPTVANPASCSALTLANYAACEKPQDIGQETRVSINLKASPTSTPGPQLFIPGTVELQSSDAVDGNQVCAALKGEFEFDLGCKPLEFIPSDNPDSKVANFNFLTEKFLKGTYNLVAYVKTLDGRTIQDFKQVNIGQPSNINLELVELFGRPADQFNIKNLIAGNPDSAKFVQTSINPDDSVTVTFKTDSAVEVYWNSVVLTSAALADSTTGYVTVTVPKWFNLEPGSKHRLTAYAYDVANPTMLSQNIIVDFKVKGSYFPYLFALLGLMILVGLLIKVARSKSNAAPQAPIEPTIDDLTFKAVGTAPTTSMPPVSPVQPLTPTMPESQVVNPIATNQTPENPIVIDPNNNNTNLS